MFLRNTISLLPQGRKALRMRKAIVPVVCIFLLMVCTLRFRNIFSIVAITEAITETTRTVPTKTRTRNDRSEKEALRQQLKRIRDVEHWGLLGDIKSTGEAMYEDKTTKRMLTNEANIAFFLQLAKSNILLAPRLLSRIWHPENVYCIHLDNKISLELRKMFISAIKSNPKLSNVMILPSTPVTYGGISMLLNTLESIQALLAMSQEWDYYINLSGSDYPLTSMTGLRRLLGRSDVLNSSISFIQFAANRKTWDQLAIHRLGRLHFDLSLGFHEGSNEELIETRFHHPILLPGKLRIQIAKGEAWIIGHRQLCEIAAHGNVARRLVTLFANMQSAPEHFFQTLVWNHKDLNRTVARYSFRNVLWFYDGKPAGQHPYHLDEKSSHGDWAMWHVLAHSPNFFARKFRIPDSNLMDHIDIHKSGATDRIANLTAVSQSFGILTNRFSCVADIHAPQSRRNSMDCFRRGWRERGCTAKIEELCVGDLLEPPR